VYPPAKTKAIEANTTRRRLFSEKRIMRSNISRTPISEHVRDPFPFHLAKQDG